MAKLGFSLPPDLEQDLKRLVPWGSKQRIIEGLLRILVARLKSKDYSLWDDAMNAYYKATSGGQNVPTSGRRK